MSGFAELPLHPDVADGIRSLQTLGPRLVTLSNGSSAVAEGLLERTGLRGAFDALMSVQDAPAWKPAASAYRYALETCAVSAEEAMLVAVHPLGHPRRTRVRVAHRLGQQAGGRCPDHAPRRPRGGLADRARAPAERLGATAVASGCRDDDRAAGPTSPPEAHRRRPLPE